MFVVWGPYLTEANHSMEQLMFHKFGSACKATYTAIHQLNPRILASIFHVHLVGTMKFAIVHQHFWKVQDIGYLLLGVKELVQDIKCV
jgi:ribulose-5-phosphate 4-epimerase/fuculose-1-phosphate aldolase